MRPLSTSIPKFLIPVDDQPFAHYQLKLLAFNGVTDIVLCIGHLGEKIQEFVGSGSKWGLKVQYVNEGSELRGTGGALRLAYDQGALASDFMVLYGDSYLPISYPSVLEAFHESNAEALMTVLKNENQWDRSNVCYDSGKVSIYDKKNPTPSMHYIDYGLSLFRKSVIEHLIRSGDKVDLAEIFHRLSLEGRLAGYPVEHRFYEIGSISGLESFREFLKSRDKEKKL
jgi:NDP-sugar pyrophosphorylase family protein